MVSSLNTYLFFTYFSTSRERHDMHAHIHVYTYTHSALCMHTDTNTPHTHAHAHAHTHTHTHSLSRIPRACQQEHQKRCTTCRRMKGVQKRPTSVKRELFCLSARASKAVYNLSSISVTSSHHRMSHVTCHIITSSQPVEHFRDLLRTERRRQRREPRNIRKENLHTHTHTHTTHNTFP
jgi:hypothetical protein